MNKRQKLVQQQFLDNEEAVIRRLKAVYNQSLKDIESKTKVLQNEINGLQTAYDAIEDEKERARLKSMQQSKIYQKQYQDALKKQISSILDNMQVAELETVADYLNKCYEEGFLGTVYDLHGQGIPVMFPIDQEAVVRAVQLDSKISQGLYQRLGEDIDLLKRKITAQVSRGISTGMSFDQVAQQLVSYTNIGFNNAVRIARTEGHRIQVQSGLDACYKAKEKGADVVKQWDSTLDGSTRPSHKKVDGEIRELDEKFSNGLMFPGDPSGGATEVVNCRCALLQRARWALDEEELATLKERAKYYGLDKSDNFKEFKEKYLKAVEEIQDTGRNRSGQRVIRKGKTIADGKTIATNKYGNEITFDIANAKNQERAEAGKKVLMQLSNEYDTYLTSVGVGAKKASGSVDGIDGKMLLNNWLPETYIHEFAHAMTTTDRIKLGFADDREIAFMNELKKIRKAYRAELYGNPKKGISANPSIGISMYADESIDEFFAEAFAQAKMMEMGMELPQSFRTDTKYSSQVLDLVDKYFKKTPLENIGKSSTIKVHKSVGAAGKNYPVKLLDSKQHVKLAQGQTINGTTFAGKGTSTEIRERFRLERDYGIPADEWKKVSGNGSVIIDGKATMAELHWYEADGEIVEMKVKRYLDES